MLGQKYTAVMLDDGTVGVALSQVDSSGCSGEQTTPPARPAGAPSASAGPRPVAEVLPLLTSSCQAEAAIGLACLNALVNRPATTHMPGDLLDHLCVRRGDIVGMVGFFGPLVDPLGKLGTRLYIFELKARPGCLPAEKAYEILLQCDIAILTGATLINGTIDSLLEASRACREVALVGASVPLLPTAFRDTPVTWLSGSIVTDGERVLEVVARGGGRREFSRFLSKANVRVEQTAM